MKEPEIIEEIGETHPLDKNRVEITLEEDDKDLFDDAFGKDAEKEKARKKRKEKIAEQKAKTKSKKKTEVEEADPEEEPEKEDEEEEEDGEEEDEESDGKNDDLEADDDKGKKNNDSKESDDSEDDDEEDDDEEDDKEEIEEKPQKQIKTPKKQKIRLRIGKNGKRKEIEIGDDEEDEEDDEEEIEDLPESKDEIKSTILAKAKKSAGIKETEQDIEKLNTLLSIDETLKPELKLLTDEKEGIAFIGRKKSIFQQYGDQASLFVGKITEDSMKDTEVYLDSLNPHVVFVCGSRGSGKCLTGDTEIVLASGEVVEIKNLADRNEKVLGLDGMLKISALEKEGFYERTVENILKIKLRSGKEIKLTPEHPLLTVNGWKPAEYLETGSRIATPRVLPSFGNLEMKECDVKLLAYLIAEGHLGNSFVLFSNNDNKISQDFKESVYDFDDNLRIEVHSKEGCYRVAQKKKKVDISNIKRDSLGRFKNKSFIIAEKSSLAQWLGEIGLYGKTSLEKFVPTQIMKLKKEQISLFLNRLFSCDGTIHRINRTNNWQISYASSSEKLIKQVQHLLLRFGVIGKLRKKKVKYKGKYNDSFELVLNSKNVIKFIDEIGFYGKKEIKQENALEEMLCKKRNPNVDTVPKDIWADFKPRSWTDVGREFGYSSPKSLRNSIEYSPSREKLLKIAQIEQNIGIQVLANSDIFWDEIISIEEMNEKTKVYDISVPQFHNFVANDIIVHNSYVLGVIAEELALQNKDVGIVVVDPIGVFWSMKHPNKEAKEIKLLKEWDLEPQGLDCLKVFIPEGVKNDVPKSTYDATFSLQPGLLTTDDWCLTFGIDRFSTSGLLMEKALTKLKSGYKTTSGKYMKANRDYSLEDLINCFETDSEINSRERGYKADSIRALVSRFDAAQNWGIFSKHGTPLSEISRAGQLAIIDTSFLDESVGALVIGIIARRLLAARKINTRHEAAERFQSDMDSLLELDIPPTWLFIDEAHTLIPSGNVKTAATSALVEYVKQGRRPGCSLVFATQQPSAIDTKVLSQLDVIMTHKLVFDDDVKAVYKRTPTIIPARYKRGNFIKTLPVGTALMGDRREETSRAFVMKIRPRMSQHEGRDAETVQSVVKMDDQRVIDMAIEMAYSKLSERAFKTNKIDQVVRSLNAKHDADISLSEVLDGLEERGVIIDPKTGIMRLPDTVYPGEEKEVLDDDIDELDEDSEYDDEDEDDDKDEEDDEKDIESELDDDVDDDEEIIEKEATEIKVFKRLIEKPDALRTFGKMRKKKFLGLLGDEERLESVALKYIPVYKVRYNYFDSKNIYSIGQAYINSYTGEFLHFKNKLFESKGLQDISNLNESEIKMILLLSKSKKSFAELTKKSEFDEAKSKRVLEKLVAQGFAGTVTENEKSQFWSKKELDLPSNPLHPLLTSLGNVPLHDANSISLEPERFGKDKLPEILQKLWKRIVIKDVKRVYLPVYEGTFKFKDGRGRVVLIEALKGMEVR